MARLNTRPVLAGAAVGLVAAIAIILLPATALESIVNRTHLANFLTAAKPPLGGKARLILGLIPFVLAGLTGLVLGLVLGGKKKIDPYGDYGAYTDYDTNAPIADPFAPAADPFTPILPVPQSHAPPETPVSEPIAEVVTPAAPPPVASPPAQAQLDGATASDLAEIAEAVVRLDARLEAIEARLDTSASKSRGKALPADLSARLAKIAQSLDAAG